MTADDNSILTDVAPAATRAAFREAMGQLAAGVSLVTTWIDDRPWGLTVSATCSVSMSPPLFLVSLGSSTTSARVIASEGAFGVGILSRDLLPAAEVGSAPQSPKFVDEFCSDLRLEGFLAPVVANALVHIDCNVVQAIDAGDHTLFLGSVNRVQLNERSDAPLLYYSRGYRYLDEGHDNFPQLTTTATEWLTK